MHGVQFVPAAGRSGTGTISIRGARTHNLKNVDVDIPRDRLVVITGLSGSGKSSLAFDTIYAEGQRRYVESLSAYARQFLSVMEKPDVDHIEGLSPAIAIEQRAGSGNPRSTVGTVTEIHDYLRLLFARVGEPRCLDHGVVLESQTVSQMVDAVLARPSGERLMLLAPLVRGRKGEHHEVFESLRSGGFVRARVDGRVVELDPPPRVDAAVHHDVEAVVDRFRVRPDLGPRLAESFETALALADGRAAVAAIDAEGGTTGEDHVFSARFACPECGYSIPELEPRLFSFNSPAGACAACDGLGRQSFFDPERVVSRPEVSLPGGAVRGWDRSNAYYFGLLRSLAAHYRFDLDIPFRELPARVRDTVLHGSRGEPIEIRYGRRHRHVRPFEGIIPNMERRYWETESAHVREELARYMSSRPCPDCDGRRLNRHARSVWVAGRDLPGLERLPVADLRRFLGTATFDGYRGEIAGRLVHEIVQRLDFLIDVGLDYLSLDRAADSLSGGEGRRIRLASQIGAGLVGVMYILDEPSIGLHQRDNRRLLESLVRLRDLGNTVIVVEHDEGAIREADCVIDMGPGPGVHGGEVVARGTVGDVMAEPASITGQYLSGRLRVSEPRRRRSPAGWIRVEGASANNLRSVNAAFPLSVMTCVTGVSGSGKSSLVHDTLYRALSSSPGPEAGSGSPRADRRRRARRQGGQHRPEPHRPHPAVESRHLRRALHPDPGAVRGHSGGPRPGLLARPLQLQRRPAAGARRAAGTGSSGWRCTSCRTCTCAATCAGAVATTGRPSACTTAERPCTTCSAWTAAEARAFFDPIPAVARRLQTLVDVGLGYIGLGQSATTLSGGEAQRMKLARELSRRESGRTLYVLDEPTTGLHFHDVRQLLDVLDRLVNRGNTVVVIEHNLDVIRAADWIVDLGPEGGRDGGRVVAAGTPEAVASVAHSHTGRYLAATGTGRSSGEGRPESLPESIEESLQA